MHLELLAGDVLEMCNPGCVHLDVKIAPPLGNFLSGDSGISRTNKRTRVFLMLIDGRVQPIIGLTERLGMRGSEGLMPLLVFG